MAKADAFISYVRENKAVVDRLAADLRARGVKVWLDRKDIIPGQRWKLAINKAIKDGAFFIACFSKEFMAKEETYMLKELRQAIDRLQNMRTGRIWFIPVLLDNTKIPWIDICGNEDLSEIQSVSLYEDWEVGVTNILQAMNLDDTNHRRVLHLIELIRYHPAERLHAIEQVPALPASAASAAVPVLMQMLQEGDTETRVQSVITLFEIGAAASAAVPSLIEALKDPEAAVRWRAVATLGKFGPASAAAIPALMKTLYGSEEDLVWRSSVALGKIGAAAVPVLIKALDDPCNVIRVFAACALRDMGPQAVDAISALIKCIADGGGSREAQNLPYDPWPFEEALSRIGVQAVPALIGALANTDARVRQSAAKALRLMRSVAAPAVPALIDALGDESVESALKSIDPAAMEALEKRGVPPRPPKRAGRRARKTRIP